MNETKTIEQRIQTQCERFLENWDRHQWMVDHGDWESEKWEDAREEYDEAVADLKAIVHALASGDRTGWSDRYEIESMLEAAQAVAEAQKALHDQVTPDESDYIAEGVIDPDEVKDKAIPCHVHHTWRGWDCTEGWGAYRHGDALYLHWCRTPDGGSARHDRDLWVKVNAEFFAE